MENRVAKTQEGQSWRATLYEGTITGVRWWYGSTPGRPVEKHSWQKQEQFPSTCSSQGFRRAYLLQSHQHGVPERAERMGCSASPLPVVQTSMGDPPHPMQGKLLQIGSEPELGSSTSAKVVAREKRSGTRSRMSVADLSRSLHTSATLSLKTAFEDAGAPSLWSPALHSAPWSESVDMPNHVAAQCGSFIPVLNCHATNSAKNSGRSWNSGTKL